MRTHLFVLAGSTLLIAPVVRAEPEPAARQAIDQMVEAITKAKALSFHVEIRGVGGYFEMLPVIKAEAIAARAENNPAAWKMRMSGRGEAANMEPTEILYVTDGVKHTWVDFPAKQVLERPSRDLGPVGQAANAVAVREVFEAQPFSRERTYPTMKVEPQVELDGVNCDVVFVDQGENLSKARYSIATTDRLPRKVEMIIQGNGIDGKRVWILTKVKVDVEPPAGSFAISTPDGFTFSPAAAPPPPPQPVPTATPVAPTKVERAVGPNINDLAPDFELVVAGSSDKTRLSSLRGSVVVVDFWGTWNLTSKKTTAELQKIAVAYKDKPVKVLGLAVREGSEAAPAKFFKDNNLTYTLLLKGDEPAKAYRVKKYPTLFVIGKEGEVVFSISNYDDKSAKEITDAIDRALAGSEKPVAKQDPTGSAIERAKGEPAGKPNEDADK